VSIANRFFWIGEGIVRNLSIQLVEHQFYKKNKIIICYIGNGSGRQKKNEKEMNSFRILEVDKLSYSDLM
jgi:hypothetical protein